MRAPNHCARRKLIVPTNSLMQRVVFFAVG